MMSEIPDFDGQEGAEALDALLDDDGSGLGEEQTFEELAEVEDLTQVKGDRDDDEALAMDADEFDPDAVGDGDTEDDDELNYRAATAEHEDDLDGLGPAGGFDEVRLIPSEVDGLGEVRDASEAQGGEDDFTDFQSRVLSDEDLDDLGYR